MNKPDVLPSVSYQDMRPEQSGGLKLLRQCSQCPLAQCGQALGLNGMVNICESLINVVNADKPNGLTGLNQKVSGQV